jgi:hypothetical protein
VFERDNVLVNADVLKRLAADASVRPLVDALTRPRLFVPVALVPVSPTREAVVAVPLLRA